MRRRPAFRAFVAAAFAAGFALAPVPPATAVDINTLRVGLSRMNSGLSSPTAIAVPRAGSGRIFITQKGGAVRVRLANGSVQTYLNVPGVLSGGERGLLGIAFHPSFSSNGYFFVAFTDGDGALQVSRFRASPASANSVSASTQFKIINVPHPTYGNHNAGQLAFGPDGYLYIGTGDGGGGGDPGNNAHDTTKLLGKILRLNVSPSCTPYCIPSTNPFATSSTSKKEIWDYGLRNPWRFSFDRSGGSLWIADVGQNAIEEINRTAAGKSKNNFGWDCWEGTSRYTTASYCTSLSATTRPIAQYDHSAGDCAVIGGYVYRGSRYAANMAGIYIFGDYCTGVIRGLQSTSAGWRMRQLHNHSGNLTSFGEDAAGELYAVDEAGSLFRVTASGGVTAPPPAPKTSAPAPKPSPPKPSPTPSRTPSPPATPSPTPTFSQPPLAQGRTDGGGGVWPWVLAGVGGVAALSGGAWWLWRRRVS